MLNYAVVAFGYKHYSGFIYNSILGTVIKALERYKFQHNVEQLFPTKCRIFIEILPNQEGLFQDFIGGVKNLVEHVYNAGTIEVEKSPLSINGDKRIRQPVQSLDSLLRSFGNVNDKPKTSKTPQSFVEMALDDDDDDDDYDDDV